MKLAILWDGKWRICAVKSDRGDCQLIDFLQEQESNMDGTVSGILDLLDYIANNPNGPRDLSDKQSHKLGSGLWEFIRGGIRIGYFYDEGKIIICTHGFKKGSQKTPRKEIDTLRNTRDAYFQQKANGEEFYD